MDPVERINLQSLRPLLASTALLLAVLACSGIPWPDLTLGPRCDQVQLARTSGQPGDTIRLQGIPDAMMGIYAEVSTDQHDDLPPIALHESESGDLDIIVPLHPNGISGGELTLVVTNGQLRCPELTLEVDAIPPAPGTLERYVEALDGHLSFWRDRAGVSRQDLLSGYIEPELLPLAAAQTFYDGPNNPKSLVRVAEGTAEFDSAAELDRQVLDAILSHSGVAESLESLSQASPDIGLGQRAAGHAAHRHQRIAAGELSEDMEQQASCLRTLNGATGKLLNDADFAIAAVGVANGPAGLTLAAAKLAAMWPLEYCAYRLPSEFTSMTVDVSHEHFKEDFDFNSEFPVVRSVVVTARSEVWNLTGIMVDTVLLFGGGIDEAGQAAKASREVGMVSQANAELAGATNNLCQRSDCGDGISFSLDPEHTDAIDIYWPEFVKFTGLRSITTGEFGLYRPAATGPGGLRVETLPVFGDARSAETLEMNVAAIEVDLNPSSVVLEPGQSQQFTLSISNAEHPELNQWTQSSPDGGESPVAQDSESYTFTAPAEITTDLDPDPCVEKEVWGILVESTSRTGLRKDGDPPRSDTAVITVVRNIAEQNPELCGTPTPTPTPEPDECLHGTWAVDPQSYNRYLEQLLSGGDITGTSAEGMLDIEFEPDWLVTINMNMNITLCTSEGCITSNIREMGSASYGVDTETNTLSVGGGIPIVASLEGFTGEGGTTPSASAEYICEGDSLTILASGAPPLEYNRADD